MAGLLGTLHSAASGMTVSQTAIQTTSHNINNMNTPGYTRQRVEQSANRPFSQPGLNSYIGAGQLGTGVKASEVIRVRNSFYDYQYRSESHKYGDIAIKYDYYNNMENIFNEPSDDAISSNLNNFFTGWHELTKDPNGVGAKNVVVENSKFLANSINQAYKKLGVLETNIDKQSETIVNDINSMLNQLKDLEKNIKVVEATGKNPNDLLDERDKILDELSFKIDITNPDVQNAMKDGSITMDEIKAMDNPSGEIAGTIAMKKELESYKNDLNELAKGIAEGVNGIYNESGNPEDDFFIFDANGDPILKVNEKFVDDPQSLEMTSEKALALYNLKDEKLSIGGKDTTIDGFYNSMIQKLGYATQDVVRNEKNQSTLMLSIDNSRLSVSGVSMDEEMINLIQFQHAYNASAKVVSTIDSLLDVVINGLIR